MTLFSIKCDMQLSSQQEFSINMESFNKPKRSQLTLPKAKSSQNQTPSAGVMLKWPMEIPCKSLIKLEKFCSMGPAIMEPLRVFVPSILSQEDILETLPEDQEDIQDPLQLVEVINDKVNTIIETLGGPDKYLEALNEMLIDKVETISIATTSAEGKAIRANEGQLFSRFPLSAMPAAAPSEDEEDVPSRSILKKQAQQLVDIKSRRKGFTFRR
ncbi:uncharacterized protein LOC143211175 [Lasioglossum baleicum]|uniref:uncharacterized protein LOC143211175 n=1 Tax=Lasioglossum baleicum TaxID=434251 RepID=UPI003FCCE50D